MSGAPIMTGMSKADPAHGPALTRLAEFLGPRGYTDATSDMAPWLTDWRGHFHGAAYALLSPGDADEVAGIVAICAAARIAIVPQGGNSGMVGGATPDESGRSVLLSLRRLSRIIDIDVPAGLVRCEAGVVLQTLHEALEPLDMRFPLTLGGKGSATIGGLISTNAGGTQVLRHGTMRALVEGLEAVLPDGQRLDLMTPLKKDNRGYDLRQLLIGAEGTLGIVTAATLRIVPALRDRAVVWSGVASPDDAYRLLRFLEARCGNRLEGFEIAGDNAIHSVLTHIAGTRAPLAGQHAWHALAEIVTDTEDQADAHALAERLFGEALETGLIADAAIAANETQAEAFWKLRDTIAEAERVDGPALQHDVSVPVADMTRFIAIASAEVEAHFDGVEVLAFGHLGDGNVHFHVKAPADAAPDWQEKAGKPVGRFIYDIVTRFGGSISAEHGIGQLKREELARLSQPARMAMLTAIKRAVDPLNIMNPGKVVSLAPSSPDP